MPAAYQLRFTRLDTRVITATRDLLDARSGRIRLRAMTERSAGR